MDETTEAMDQFYEECPDECPDCGKPAHKCTCDPIWEDEQ